MANGCAADFSDYNTIVYIDIEGRNFENLSEIAAIAFKRNYLQEFSCCKTHQELSCCKTYWNLCTAEFMNSKNAASYNFNASFCHCIGDTSIRMYGKPFHRIQNEFTNYFNSLPRPILLRSNGEDVSTPNLVKAFPLIDSNNISWSDIQLPPWRERDIETYHQVVRLLKREDFRRPPIIHCRSFNHGLKLRKPKRGGPSSQIKFEYGYHCAAMDSLELAFKDGFLNDFMLSHLIYI